MSRLGAVQFVVVIGIVAILAAEAAFSIIGAANGVVLSHEMRARAQTAARYRDLESLLAQERIAERSFLISQSPEFLADLSSTQSLIAARVAWLQKRLSQARVVELRRFVDAHDRYARIASSMIARVQGGDRARAQVIDAREVAPAYASVSRTLHDGITAFVARTDALNDEGIARATYLRGASIGAAAVGLTLVGALMAVLAFYKRRGDEAIALRLASLELAARTDALTGVGNMHAFRERLPSCTRLLLVDIDDFKAANDARGQTASDDLLVRLAQVLAVEFASDDIFRLHADRFAVLVRPRPRSVDERLSQSLIHACARRLHGLTVSAGYAEAQRSDEDEDLLERAEAALAAAKREGGHLFVRYEDVRSRVFVYSTSRARAFRRLMDERAVEMQFQPIVETLTGRIIAYEALARAPERFGLDNTQELFDIAERLHRSFELDQLCIRAALLSAARQKPNALLFINAAPASLESERLNVARCFSDIRAVGLDPRNIVIELTERKIANSKLLASRIAQIQEWGMRVALDDTGAGYAGLDVLSAMTFDFVKIDRSLIIRAMTDERARSVLLGLISIAHGAGSTVIAEGIETPAMQTFMRTLETNAAVGTVAACQGYAFAHPRPEFVETIPAR